MCMLIININSVNEMGEEEEGAQKSRHKSSFRSLIDVKNEISPLICLRNGNRARRGEEVGHKTN